MGGQRCKSASAVEVYHQQACGEPLTGLLGGFQDSQQVYTSLRIPHEQVDLANARDEKPVDKTVFLRT